MRTSIDLNDRLLTLAKHAATKRGITLREVFEQALRAYLEPSRKQEGYKLELGITHGEVVPGVPVDDWSALRGYVAELDTADDFKRYRK
ncbi:MAG TPA: hypothetical protein VFV99_20945 [Kofleriaceae bacterium]|nr:hypothetical protein [Kofleriaceae bacterium]